MPFATAYQTSPGIKRVSKYRSKISARSCSYGRGTTTTWFVISLACTMSSVVVSKAKSNRNRTVCVAISTLAAWS